MARVAELFNATAADLGEELDGWWYDVNESRRWQDGIFFFLAGAYALVSSIALVSSLLLSFFYAYSCFFACLELKRVDDALSLF